jgi:hypothetical protein
MASFVAGLSMNLRFDSNAGLRRVAIVGAVFARLAVARKLASAPADILLIERHNDNRFEPLPIAWLVWGAVHIYLLIGLRNHVAVLLSWVWAWLTPGRGARLITGEEPGAAHAPQVLPVSKQLFGRS